MILAGNLDRIEIWSKSRWEKSNNYEDMDAIAKGLQEIGVTI